MSGFTLCSGAKPGKRDLTRRWDCAHGTYFGGADDFRLWPKCEVHDVRYLVAIAGKAEVAHNPRAVLLR
jgi:hypothetical protein